jgi:hypothetical protein
MNSATKVFASTFGAVMAIAGVEHGIGEILQGNAVPGGLMILSWPESVFFHNLGGEPAMTVVPNLLLTGVLAVIVSLALLLWCLLFLHRKNGGAIMIALSIAMLLVGGGIFPPIFGILIGIVAARIHRPFSSLNPRRASGFQRFLAGLWPFSYAACILAWVSVMPAAYLFGGKSPVVILAVLLFALGTMVLTMVSGFEKDIQAQARERSNSRDLDSLNSQSVARKPSSI